jgi:hypothetical protein
MCNPQASVSSVRRSVNRFEQYSGAQLKALLLLIQPVLRIARIGLGVLLRCSADALDMGHGARIAINEKTAEHASDVPVQ